MRQGLTPEISAAKQTNLQYLVKLRAAPAQESQPGLKTACKGTEKNRNERMSKSEISKKSTAQGR